MERGRSTELRIFSAKKTDEKPKLNEDEPDPKSKGSDQMPDKEQKPEPKPKVQPKPRNLSPTKLLQRLLKPLSPERKDDKSHKSDKQIDQKMVEEEGKDSEEAIKTKKKDSEAHTSQDLVIKKGAVQLKATVTVMDYNGNVDRSPALKANEFLFNRPITKTHATFTLDRPRKLTTQKLKSPGLVLASLSCDRLNEPSVSVESFRSGAPTENKVSDEDEEYRTPTPTPTSGLPKFPAPEVAESKEDEMVQSVNGKTKKMAEKLSRSFFDLTMGSQDRLAKWKSKLKEYGGQKGKGKGQSMDSDLKHEVNTLPVVNRRHILSSLAPPRPLHSSHSAQNALIAGTSNTLPHLHKSASVREDDILMEHRTLKPVGRLTPDHIHDQHMLSLHELVQSIEGFNDSDKKQRRPLGMSMSVANETSQLLPPPARIMPWSGVKPQDNGIVRPIAFRPIQSKVLAENRNSNSPDVKSSFSLQNKQNLKDHSRSIGNLSSTAIPTRPQLYQPSTSQLFGGKSIGSLPQASHDENDYDTVSDYIDRKRSNEGSNYSSMYHTNQHAPRSHSHAGCRAQTTSFFCNPQHTTSSTSSHFTASSTSSSSSTNSPGLKKSESQPRAGVHVTPSPSDSGIVDYETLIRDKENELTSVRQAMEQNEEVLIRVYQDKERRYKDQIGDLNQKLHLAQQNEKILRQQLRQSEERRQLLQDSVKRLSDDKQSMQRRCGQIERELQLLKTRLDARESCDNCDKKTKPVPAPRLLKDSELRTEVKDLKGEVSTLKAQLNHQMQFFTEDWKRWENDRNGNKATHFSSRKPLVSTDRLI
ncbi:unnamed protein product [Bursaphelenchus okinawaensis]|uniref:Uncharacterized protein n=1 Tax=Bursaphelenchus okinawaensis TaxID=465554 RepID=A0A811LMY3_9BILA|nr:unnamed protein product [Bursaphelenchus okinawaensis]CAG9125756.1 unnamed protein product [Bursaphelenchus okinawaensis]